MAFPGDFLVFTFSPGIFLFVNLYCASGGHISLADKRNMEKRVV